MWLGHVSKANVEIHVQDSGYESACDASRYQKGQAHHGSDGAEGLPRADPQFPVVFSTRPHPIPSRTRKLSLSEPMVLQGKPCGRVGRCRDYFSAPKEPRSLESCDSGLLLFVRRNCSETTTLWEFRFGALCARIPSEVRATSLESIDSRLHVLKIL